MSTLDATLHMLCGKIAAGKSSLAARLAAAPHTVALSEDHWLARLYPGQINSVADYVRHAAQLREAIAPHVEALLGAGLSVVLDFPAHTVANRAWMRGIIERSGAQHVLCSMSSTFPTRSAGQGCRRATRRANTTSRPATPSLTPSPPISRPDQGRGLQHRGVDTGLTYARTARGSAQPMPVASPMMDAPRLRNGHGAPPANPRRLPAAPRRGRSSGRRAGRRRGCSGRAASFRSRDRRRGRRSG